MLCCPLLGDRPALTPLSKWPEWACLEKFGVEMIGASIESIKKAEDRDLFRKAMNRIGL